MFRVRFRTGHKLAASAVLGVAFVVALLGTVRWSMQRIDAQNGQSERTQQVLQLVAGAETAMRGIEVLYRDIRLAGTSEETAAVDKRLRSETDLVRRGFAKGAEQAPSEADRDRLKQAEALLNRYSAAVQDGVAAQSELLDVRQAQMFLARSWDTGLDQVRTLVLQDAGAHADRFSLTLEGVDAKSSRARALMWRYLGTGEDALRAQCMELVEQAGLELRLLQAEARGKLADAVEALAVEAERLQQVIVVTIDAALRQTTITRTRIEPLRREILAVVEATRTSLNEQSASAAAELTAAISWGQQAALALGALVVAVLVGSALFGALAVARPIRRIAGVLHALADGDTAVDIPYGRRGDEVGDAAKAAAAFKANLIRMGELAQERAAAEAAAEAEKKRALLEIAEGFETAVGGVVEQVTMAAAQLEGAAQTMSAAADETTRQSGAVAAAAEEATSNVQTVAVAAEELSTSVAEISRQVVESARIAADAMRDADATGAKVSRLSAAAQKIGDVVGLISTIAAQTNLLALNATIEAARAGEAGRGFAVVASEVKALANQTATATSDIARQIDEIQSSTSDSAAALGSITATIRRMSEISTAVAAAMEEQGAATQEIARNVQQASSGTAGVSENIAGVSRAAAESSGASGQVLTSAGSLSHQAGKLSDEVRRFLVTVRTGPLDRRVADDPNYAGPERRVAKQAA